MSDESTTPILDGRSALVAIMTLFASRPDALTVGVPALNKIATGTPADRAAAATELAEALLAGANVELDTPSKLAGLLSDALASVDEATASAFAIALAMRGLGRAVEGHAASLGAANLGDALADALVSGIVDGDGYALHTMRLASRSLPAELVPADLLGALREQADHRFSELQGLAAKNAQTSVRGWRVALSSIEHVASGKAFPLIRDVIATRVVSEQAEDREARNRLATTIGDSARDFLESADFARRAEAFVARPERASLTVEDFASHTENGILFADELFAQHLERIGAKGRAAAEKNVRAKARARMRAHARAPQPGALWSLWNDPARAESLGAPWIELLAYVLWLDVVGPTVTRERKNPPALVMPVHEDVARIHSRARRLEERSGQRALVFDDHDPIIITPTIADEAVNALVARGVGLLGSITAHRALRWELYEGHSRAQRGEADARVLRVDGGWSTFAADMLGLKKKGSAEDLRAIVHAQASVVMKLPSGSTGNMLALRETPQRGRTRGSIEIVLGTMLLPHFVYELNELGGREASEARRLVPVVDLPPMVGRQNDHGQQATLSMLVVRELRARARELATGEGASIDLDRWAALAQQAGLPRGLLERVRDRWVQDGDDGPAFLEQTAPGRYTLGGAHALARVFLEASGRIELEASEAGKRSVAAREAKRRRLGRGR